MHILIHQYYVPSHPSTPTASRVQKLWVFHQWLCASPERVSIDKAMIAFLVRALLKLLCYPSGARSLFLVLLVRVDDLLHFAC
jgi:hypothetical protein